MCRRRSGGGRRRPSSGRPGSGARGQAGSRLERTPSASSWSSSASVSSQARAAPRGCARRGRPAGPGPRRRPALKCQGELGMRTRPPRRSGTSTMALALAGPLAVGHLADRPQHAHGQALARPTTPRARPGTGTSSAPTWSSSRSSASRCSRDATSPKRVVVDELRAADGAGVALEGAPVGRVAGDDHASGRRRP